MTISAVVGQQVGATVDASSTSSKAYPGNVTAGNLVVVFGTRSNLGANTAFVAGDCTKSAGTATLGPIVLVKQNTFDVGASDFLQTGIWAAVVTGSGSLTMQVSLGTNCYSIIGIGEFSSTVGWGSTPTIEDSNSGQTATDSTTAWNTSNMTSAGAALFLGACSSDDSGDVALLKDTNWTLVYSESDTSLHTAGLHEYRIASSGLTDQAKGTINTNNIGWVVAGAVIKESGAAAAVSAERTSVTLPGLDLGRPTSKLRSASATSQMGQLAVLALSATIGMADLQPLSTATSEQRPLNSPRLHLGSPTSRLRSAQATDQVGQLSTLSVSSTVGSGELSYSSPTAPSFNSPELDLGSPLAKLRAKYATDQMGQLSALAISATVGPAALTGTSSTTSSEQGYVSLPDLGLGTPRSKLRASFSTDQPAPPLAALALTVDVGWAQLDGAGALTAFGVSTTVGLASLGGSVDLSALGLSVTVGPASLIGVGALAALGLSATVGSATQFDPGAAQTLSISTTIGMGDPSGISPSLGGSDYIIRARRRGRR